MRIDYKIGQKLDWRPDCSYEAAVRVTVTGLRMYGHATLSNGRVVNEEGSTEGSDGMHGGYVTDAKK